MTFSEPGSLDLRGLFRDPDMFDSRSCWAEAGFQVLPSGDKPHGKIMVARHPLVQGLLFKKYPVDVSQRDQRENYKCRLKGSQRLRSFLEDRGLTRVVVPRKWIVELPRKLFRRGTLLLVERLDLRSDEQTVAAYHAMEEALLSDLCTVLFHFRGMDSNAMNLPFLVDGRIGLVDTEHWNRRTHKAYLHHVGEHMSAGSRKIAKKIFDHLEKGKDVGDLDASDRFDDFFDGQDTSSSSSS